MEIGLSEKCLFWTIFVAAEKNNLQNTQCILSVKFVCRFELKQKFYFFGQPRLQIMYSICIRQVYTN